MACVVRSDLCADMGRPGVDYLASLRSERLVCLQRPDAAPASGRRIFFLMCHHAAVGLSISRLALAPGSTSTLISTSATATERVRKLVRVRVRNRVRLRVRKHVRVRVHKRVRVRVRKCVRVRVRKRVWVWVWVWVWVPLHVSGSGTERVLGFVRAVASHVPDSSTVKAVPLTQPRSPIFFRDFSPASSHAQVHSVGVWGLSSTILRWVGNRGGG